MQAIYILGSVGSQSIEMFKKIEDIAMQRIQSTKSLRDIFKMECKTSPSCRTGFTHNPTGHTVFSYNNSGIITLNGVPDNIRSKRSTLTVFDESAFASNELLTAAVAFSTQDLDFSTSIEENYDVRVEKMRCPSQLLFCSSMNDTECLFYKNFKEYAMHMFAGDKNYFVTSMPCEVVLHPFMDGEPYRPMLKQTTIDNEMKVNKQKALREFHNLPTAESEDQLVRYSSIIRNSTFSLPELYNIDNKSKYILAFDPARVGDNSILGVMKLCYDEQIGYYGEIVNCVNFLDTAKKKKMSIKTTDQIKMIYELILAYNGEGFPDYENIEAIMVDAGSGGGANQICDLLLDDWTDTSGNIHKGFVDEEHDVYREESIKYPNASRILSLVNPKKYRNQMCEQLISMMNHDLIRFPKEYSGKDYVVVEEKVMKKNKDTGKMEVSMIENIETKKMEIETELKNRQLTLEEQLALINIDIMKTETTAVHIFKDSSGNVSRYANPDTNSHDDRFYVLLLLSHKLYEIRRKNLIRQKKSSDYDFVFTYN